MDFIDNIAAVFSSGVSDAPVKFTTDIADAALSLTDSPSSILDADFIAKYMNFEFFEILLKENFVYIFLTGFAFTTVLVLLTYGAFKAFGLIRIKS